MAAICFGMLYNSSEFVGSGIAIVSDCPLDSLIADDIKKKNVKMKAIASEVSIWKST